MEQEKQYKVVFLVNKALMPGAWCDPHLAGMRASSLHRVACGHDPRSSNLLVLSIIPDHMLLVDWGCFYRGLWRQIEWVARPSHKLPNDGPWLAL